MKNDDGTVTLQCPNCRRLTKATVYDPETGECLERYYFRCWNCRRFIYFDPDKVEIN